MKKNLFKSFLLLVVLAAFSAQPIKALADNGSPTKRLKRSLSRVAGTVLHLPTQEVNYQYNENGTDLEFLIRYKYDYNAQGDMIFSAGISATGDTVSKSIYKYDYTNGKETSSISYIQDASTNILIPETRDTFYYDNQHQLISYLSQIYSPDTKEWMNDTKTDFSSSTPALLFPDNYVQYTWSNNQWVKSAEASNVVWVDYKNYEFTSGTFIEYYYNYTYRTTYTTDESGVKAGTISLLLGNFWVDQLKSTETKDTYGNAIETTRNIDGENFSRHTSLVDEKGADAGYIEETWFEDQWMVTEYFKYTNTYNNNDEMVKSERELYNFNGDGNTVKTLIEYSSFIEVITDIKASSIAGHSTSHFTYPNPSNDVLNIENTSQETMQISITNMQNNLVLSETIDAGKGSISIKDFPSGIYFLKSTTSSGKMYTEKIIKE